MSVDRQPLIIESSDLSDTANNPPTLPSLGFSSEFHSLGSAAQPHVSHPSSPATSSPQPGYTNLLSDTAAVDRFAPPTVPAEDEGDIADSLRAGSGLRIAPPVSPSVNRRVSIQTVPTGIRSPPAISPELLSPPNTGDPLIGRFSIESPDSTPELRGQRFNPRDSGGEYQDLRRDVLKKNRTSVVSVPEDNDYQRYLHSEDTERLRKGAPSIRSAYDHDFRPTQECPTARDFYQSRFSWISIFIIVICLFSTVFSGIFLGLALKKPRYGRKITSQGSFKPADAILLTSVVAKLIELSFVTSFVAFLGQVLSRRAFMKEQGRGVTLSELSMWRWVVQPGTLITHWETIKYAGISLLGILSLLSTILATLYTPAATALVQPVLKFSVWHDKLMAGRVVTDFANINHIKTLCQIPLRNDKDSGNTCLQIEHAGQGYHNYQRYLAFWDQAANVGNGSTKQQERPPGFGLLHENTTITAQWISVIDTAEVSKASRRVINKVSLAMPHSGVFQAARDQINGIMQPEELNSEGSYFLHAAVPSPVMNVLCVNMNEEELKPIVYEAWTTEVINGSTWVQQQNKATTTNKTVVDDIFGWTKQDKEKMLDYPPVFARYPRPFNTILNHTNSFWGRDSIYVLAQGGKDEGSDLTGTYSLCKVQVSITTECSTHYNATGSGGSMSAHCEDPDEKMTFIKMEPGAQKVKSVPNWKDVGFDWANSLSLNTGIADGNASNSRLLAQLILQPKNKDPNNLQVDLNPALPSMAEALAVMSGCTLLKSMMDAPFGMSWDYTVPQLDTPQIQHFRATLMAQEYGSGGVDSVSNGWVVILLLVFLMNVFVFAYFCLHRGLVTDFSEPPNLFALAVNSPPTHLLAGSCGGGPEGKQLMVNWFVNTEGDHLYMEPGEKPILDGSGHVHSHGHGHGHPPAQTTGNVFRPVVGAFNNLRERGIHFGSRKSQPLLRPVSVVESDFEMEDGNTRTQRHYDNLSKRRSML